MSKERIQTDFFDKQAKENAKPGSGRGMLIVILLLLLGGIGYGGTQMFGYFSHFEFNQLKRNVTIELREPKVDGGKAVVAVTMRNFNACDITNPTFSYSIETKDGKPLASGQAQIEGVVPTGDRRSFENVTLGPVTGQPGRVHADLTGFTGSYDKSFPKGFPARFSAAFENDGDSIIAALAKLEKEAPKYEGIPLSIGIEYEGKEQWAKALDEYKKAEAMAPANANAHYHLGMALAHEKKMGEAIAQLKKASELNPFDKTISQALKSLSASSKPPEEEPQTTEKHSRHHKRSRG